MLGQYFTPRALIAAMVACVAPAPGKTIADPACGTGGFFLAAYDYLVKNHPLDREQKSCLNKGTFRGNEIVAATLQAGIHPIGWGCGDCAPQPFHTTGHAVFRIRRLNPAEVMSLPPRRSTVE